MSDTPSAFSEPMEITVDVDDLPRLPALYVPVSFSANPGIPAKYTILLPAKRVLDHVNFSEQWVLHRSTVPGYAAASSNHPPRLIFPSMVDVNDAEQLLRWMDVQNISRNEFFQGKELNVHVRAMAFDEAQRHRKNLQSTHFLILDQVEIV